MISTSNDANKDSHKNTRSRQQKTIFCATLKNDFSNMASQQLTLLTLLQIFDSKWFTAPRCWWVRPWSPHSFQWPNGTCQRRPSSSCCFFTNTNQRQTRIKRDSSSLILLGHRKNIPFVGDPCLCQEISWCDPFNSFFWNSCYSVKIWTNGLFTIRAAHNPNRNVNARHGPTWHWWLSLAHGRSLDLGRSSDESRYLLDDLDCTLKDNMHNDELMQGKLLILASDFHQILPVVRKR